MAGGAAIATGIVLILLALYLGLGPIAANRDGSATFGDPLPYSLPSWFDFPGGVTVQVSWTQGSPFVYVGVATCTDSTCAHANSIVANGTGSSGTEDFTALPGATYEVFTDGGVQLQIQADYSVTYTLLVMILVVLGIGALGYGFLVMRAHPDLQRI